MWSKTRKQLLERLHPSLNGILDFQMSKYRKSHDQSSIEFRIVNNGNIIFKLDNLKYLYESAVGYKGISDEERWADLAKRNLYESYSIFEAIGLMNTLPIHDALIHKNELIRMLAIIDRRVGKKVFNEFDITNEKDCVKNLYTLRKSVN